MKVIVIAAGDSKRLGEITKEIPKGMLKIDHRRVLDFQIEFFKNKKVNEIIIITGKHHKIFNFSNVTYTRDIDYAKHDVLGSLMCARKMMDDELITTYSDIIPSDTIMKSLLDSKYDIGIGIDLEWEEKYKGRTQHPKEQADNVLIENGKILKIKKNILKYEEDQIIGEFIGMMKLSKNGCKKFNEVYEELRKNHSGIFHNASTFEKAYLTDMLQELIDRGINVEPIFVKDKWVEIDTEQDLENARKYFSVEHS
tara:strand:- start:475 stop:1236 length:762 start_codon:yes stop_codon:yes gene_type:complete